MSEGFRGLGAAALAVETDSEDKVYFPRDDDVDSAAGDQSQSQDLGDKSHSGSLASRSWKKFKGLLPAAASVQPPSAEGGALSPPTLSDRLSALWKRVLTWMKPQVTFYRIHFAVFFIVMMIGTLVIYISPNGVGGRLQFIDCMYVATSALCVTGLISVRMNQLDTWDKVVLMILMVLGSQVFTSLVPVYIRRHYFKKYLQQEGMYDADSTDAMSAVMASAEERMRELEQLQEDQNRGRETGGVPETGAPVAGANHVRDEGRRTPPQRSARVADVGSTSARMSPAQLDSFEVPLTPGSFLPRQPSAGIHAGIPGLIGLDDIMDDPERATNTWAGDTAQINARRLKAILEASKNLHDAGAGTPFGGLPRAMTSAFNVGESDSGIDMNALLPVERRFIELRALELLSWLVPVYFVGIQLLCFVLLLVCLLANPYYLGVLDGNGTNVVLMAAFQAISGFANAGLSLFDNNLMSFQSYVPYLLIVMALILLGNTLYAPALRFILIVIAKFGNEQQRFVSKYLLDHPRRCYTHLFPPSDTRWLVFTVLLFNTTEFIFFCALDWNSLALDGLEPGVKILDGAFQSVSTRNAGFNVINIGLLSAAMLVLYVGMMYIAVYPVYITRQRSREQREVYDDEDLQIFYEDLEEGVLDKGVLAQGKKMLSRDSALVFLSIFLICIIQNTEINTDGTNYSIFNIIFEVISAYGNVGLSIGYTCQPQFANCDPVPYSFSGVWKAGAKVVICMVMFLGRHRGLPDNIDAAILIPDQKRFRRTRPDSQAGEHAHILVRMSSAASLPNAQGTLRARNVSWSRGGAANHMDIRSVSGNNFPNTTQNNC